MKLRMIFLAVGLLTTAAAPSQGISFFEGNWEEALEKAKVEEKLIFVDAYAEWCGPCKHMARQVFPQEKVGAFYNRHFINMQIDMEKGMGLEFRKEYPVAAFPTLFFIDANGKVVKKAQGAQKADGLISLGRSALSEVDNSEEYAKKYEAGEREPEFVYKYVRALNKAGKSSLKVANEYFDTEPDLSSPFNQRFLFEAVTEADSKLFSMMIERRSTIEELMGPQAVRERILQACKATAEKAIEYNSEFLLEEAQDKMQEHYKDRADQFELETNMAFYRSQGDAKSYAKTCKKYARKILDGNAKKLHELAGQMVESFEGQQNVMKEAEKIAEEAAENSQQYQHHLAYANILRMNEAFEDAREAAERALELARDEGPRAVSMVQYLIKQLPEN
jgi:thiol-disulfide isomerase/thioredoxin